MMRKFKITTFQACYTVITLLGITLICSWITSSHRPLLWEIVDSNDRFVVVSLIDGHIALHWDYFTDPGNDDPQSFSKHVENGKKITRRLMYDKRSGLHFTFFQPQTKSQLRSYSHRTREIGFDIWLPILLFVAIPMWFVIRYAFGPLRRKYRRRKGLCEQCTYNLTGNTSGTCPECGSEVKNTKKRL